MGIDRARFQGVYNSVSMLAQINRGIQLTSRYTVDSVPLFVVAGRDLRILIQLVVFGVLRALGG